MKPIAAIALAVALSVAGCGSSSSSSSTTSSSANKPASTSASKSPPASAAKPASGKAKVKIANFMYMPASLQVKAGTKVTWTNTDSANHTVTSDSGNGVDVSNLQKGQSASYTYKKPGTYKYHCNFHPFMHGTVVVK